MLIDFVLNISITISVIYLFHRIQYSEDSAKLTSAAFQAALMVTLAVLLLFVPIEYRGYSFSLFFVPLILIRNKLHLKIAAFALVAAAHYFLSSNSVIEILIAGVLYIAAILIMPFFKSQTTPLMTWFNFIFTILLLTGIDLFVEPLGWMQFLIITFMSTALMITASVMYEDIHSIIRVLDRLNREEYTDHLTQLGNIKALDNEVNRLGSRTETISLLLIDLDNFKVVNDTYGYGAGDAVIKQITGLLKNYVPAGGSIYRNSGEEFSIVLADVSFDRTVRLAEAIRNAVEHTNFHVGKNEVISLTVSVGIGFKDSGGTRRQLFKDADNMLHAAKKMGQNQVMFLPLIK
ncbi:GGDEF domain-containing protein [Salinicoccus halitifaciens]|uniref:Diguanylate cyclase (GGDEF)-like protein n=1 Tax=Salinicoccus halitifaciens TaxID=1073415 RepID=A0ABV2ECD3_9STAP|nr:GGDEF domain-containing protein [Salinicoccus halitifaciens]MCD2138869.1 GGDEF domain-containing protein [Salinicoccus halitifaciens]